MKETTLHSLVTARTLFEEANGLCESDDRHSATAGLIVLQDALELVFLALLVERGVDETSNLESHTFDQIIGDLRKAGVTIPKSGTLKALNKHRVLAKHYAQLADPITVRSYLAAARIAIDAALEQTIGRSLQGVFLSDLLQPGECREYLRQAEEFIRAHRFFDALTEIRKAIYVEIENDYSIFDWRDAEQGPISSFSWQTLPEADGRHPSIPGAKNG